MFVQTIDPVLLTLGPLEIRWYGLVYVLGFVAGYWALRKLTDLEASEADSLIVWMMVGLLIGARGFYFAFYAPASFGLIEFVSLWHGGMSFHGGFLGVGVAAWLWCRRNAKDFLELADVGVVVAAFALAAGRVANFLNSEIVGVRTDVPWCVEFPQAQPPLDEGCRHPTQLYAVLKNLTAGVVLLWLYTRKRFSRGFVFTCFLVLYGALRFVVNIWRADPVIALGWLKMGQLLSLALLAVGAYVLATRYREDLKKLF